MSLSSYIHDQTLTWISPVFRNLRAVVSAALVHRGFRRSFQSDRRDLVTLVPKGIKSVLDVGCAMGAYAKTLKALRPELSITGVELNPFMTARGPASIMMQ